MQVTSGRFAPLSNCAKRELGEVPACWGILPQHHDLCNSIAYNQTKKEIVRIKMRLKIFICL
jgi:hypothetical protein